MINPKNEDKCLKYATVALSYKEIKYIPERVSNVKLFINKYNWKGINYPSKQSDWKKFEKNNPTVALNILYTKEKEIFPAYISNHNLIREKQIIFLMIPNEENYYIKKHRVIRLIFVACIVLYLSTENKLKSHGEVCKNKDFCWVEMQLEKF